MTKDLTVYTAAAWYRDNDAHTSVVALTPTAANDAIEEAIVSMADMDAGADDSPCWYCDDGNDGDHKECLIDAQAWSGVHADSLRSILSSMRPTVRSMFLADLRANGVAYPEAF